MNNDEQDEQDRTLILLFPSCASCPFMFKYFGPVAETFRNRFANHSEFHCIEGWLGATDGAPIYTDGIDGEQAN